MPELEDELDFISKFQKQFHSDNPCDVLEMNCLVHSLREITENFTYQKQKYDSFELSLDVIKRMRILYNKRILEEYSKSKDEY